MLRHALHFDFFFYTWKLKIRCSWQYSFWLEIARTRRPKWFARAALCCTCLVCFLDVDGKHSPGDEPHGWVSINLCQRCTSATPPDQDVRFLPSTWMASHSSKDLLYGAATVLSSPDARRSPSPLSSLLHQSLKLSRCSQQSWTY